MDMPRFCTWYSGIWRYFSSSASQPSAVSGGIAPVTGRHSVMDSPESVRRVAPPTRIMAHTKAETITSHQNMDRLVSGAVNALGMEVAACMGGPSDHGMSATYRLDAREQVARAVSPRRRRVLTPRGAGQSRTPALPFT